MAEAANLAQEEAAALREEAAASSRALTEARAALEERDADIMDLIARHKAALSSLAECQSTLRLVDGARQAAEGEVSRLGATVAHVESLRGKLAAEVDSLRRAVSERGEQLRDYRAAIEELTRQANVGPRRIHSYQTPYRAVPHVRARVSAPRRRRARRWSLAREPRWIAPVSSRHKRRPQRQQRRP